MVFVLWALPSHTPIKSRHPIKKNNRITPTYIIENFFTLSYWFPLFVCLERSQSFTWLLDEDMFNFYAKDSSTLCEVSRLWQQHDHVKSLGHYCGNFQLRRQYKLLVWTKNCYIRLAIANHKDCLSFRIRPKMKKIQEVKLEILFRFMWS
jgi:hypothetical protein